MRRKEDTQRCKKKKCEMERKKPVKTIRAELGAMKGNRKTKIKIRTKNCAKKNKEFFLQRKQEIIKKTL